MYKKFLDDLVEKNDIFDKFLDYSLDELKFNIDFDNIINYQIEVNSNKHITDFFINILDQIKFYSYEKFLSILNTNWDDIARISSDENNRLFLYFDISVYKKSNFFILY